MVFNKKAISPIVATALLLIVAVLAVVGFQTWFMSYQSGVNAKVEKESQSSSIFTVERLEADGTVYVKNGGTDRLNVTVKFPSYSSCTENRTEINGTSVLAVKLTCGSAMPKDTTTDVVVVTDKGVFTSTQIIR